MDRLLGMEVFVTVVEAGSMAAASRRLDMTSQMIGRHIQALEARLGASVLVRTTRQQKLTEAGSDYYERCKRILADIVEADRAVSATRSEPRGRLVVSAPVTLGTISLSPAIVDFMERHPRLNVELRLDDSVVDLVAQGCDAALRVGTLPDSGLVARKLAPYRFVACASPDYLRRHGTPSSLADLKDHRTLGFANWPRHGGWERELLRESGSPLPESRLSSNVGAALRTAALRGFGIVLQPAILLQDDLDAGRLVRVLADSLAPCMPVHVVFRSGRLPEPKIRAFVDFVVGRFSRSLGSP